MMVHWLLGLAILFAALGGVDHLHLCLDGQEAAVTLHGPDGDMHHQDDGRGHQDEDVDLPETGVAKSFSKGFDQPILFLAVVFLLFCSASDAPRAIRTLVQPVPLANRHLLPPLRGPPAFNLR
jgi:hypothetical protein